MPCIRHLFPWLLPVVACGGTPVEATSTSNAAEDDGDDDDDGTSDPSSVTLGSTDPSGDPTTDASADTTSATDPDATSADPTTDAGEETTNGDASTTTGDTGPDECHVVLDEVAFDVMGNDDELEWIAIHNPCSEAIELDDIALGWGGDDYTWGTQQLQGTLEPDECLVVGGPDASNANYNPVLGLPVDLELDVQNADDDAADAIALFVGDAGAIDARSVPFDAVLYGPENDNMLLDETGRPGAVDVVPGTDDETIARVPGTGTWVVNDMPSPNDCGDPAG